MYKNFKNKNSFAAFTLAEVLITLAVIGIVAVLTIPALVQNHNQKAWATAQDLFTKKLEVAMKAMATNSTVSGYDSTESFVNELKKYIKITKVCTDDVTKCFAPKVVWNTDEEAVDVTNSAVTYNENGDWAETVGIQFNNGVNALISYNKQCYADPYNNQEQIASKCVGIVYDVSGFKKPNVYSKDILAINVTELGGTSGCVYKLSDGTCFSKILGPQNDGYSALSNADCTAAKEKGEIDVDYCYNGNDYYAGAVLACGGKKANLPSKDQLTKLTQEIYNDTSITSSYKSGLSMDTEKAASFLAQSPGSNWFTVWASQESDANYAYYRFFYSDRTGYYDGSRYYSDGLAVCLGD